MTWSEGPSNRTTASWSKPRATPSSLFSARLSTRLSPVEPPRIRLETMSGPTTGGSALEWGCIPVPEPWAERTTSVSTCIGRPGLPTPPTAGKPFSLSQRRSWSSATSPNPETPRSRQAPAQGPLRAGDDLRIDWRSGARRHFLSSAPSMPSPTTSRCKSPASWAGKWSLLRRCDFSSGPGSSL